MGKLYDCIIIGSGPAGLTAAIYAARACLSVLVLEKEFVSGGQVVNTYEVDNYPGYRGISGFDLGMKFREHAEKLDVEFVMEAVERVDLEKEEKIIYTDQSEYHGRTVILAMGASHRKLEVRGEEDFSGMGVSYCATCDGAFFKGKTVAVVGGGDVAIEDAIFLSRGCEKVYLIHRRNQLRGAESLQRELFARTNIEVIWDSERWNVSTEKRPYRRDGKNAARIFEKRVYGQRFPRASDAADLDFRLCGDHAGRLCEAGGCQTGGR